MPWIFERRLKESQAACFFFFKMQRTSTDFAKCAAEGQTEMHKEVGTGREKFASSSELNQATLKINTGFFFFPSFSFFFFKF